VNRYLKDPTADGPQRKQFIRDECTFTDGSAGRRSGAWILSLLHRPPAQPKR
jgi:hypothetical protein